PVPVLRLPYVRELSVLESVRLQLRPFPDRDVRRSVLLPLPLLRRHACGIYAAPQAGAAVHLQGPAGFEPVHHARAATPGERRPAAGCGRARAGLGRRHDSTAAHPAPAASHRGRGRAGDRAAAATHRGPATPRPRRPPAPPPGPSRTPGAPAPSRAP